MIKKEWVNRNGKIPGLKTQTVVKKKALWQ